MDYSKIRRILENPQTKETLMKEISKEVPVGTFVRPGFLEERRIDPESFKPTNYPQLTEPNYDYYKGNVKHVAEKHVNNTNRNVLSAAVDEIPDKETADRTLKSVFGVDVNKDVDIYNDPTLEQKDAYGMTFPNASPMRAASTILLNPKDEMMDATLIHELKHAHDNQNSHIKIPNIDLNKINTENAKMPKIERIKDENLDSIINALSANDLNTLYNEYSGDHFDHGTTIPEDAQKILQFSKLKPFIKGK